MMLVYFICFNLIFIEQFGIICLMIENFGFGLIYFDDDNVGQQTKEKVKL